jgi:hypothetical protein
MRRTDLTSCFVLVIPFFVLQYAFCSEFILPTQGLFNALIYFHVTTKQQTRRASANTSEQTNRSSSFFALPPFRQWWSFRWSLSRQRSSAASPDPIATVVARAVQEEELQDFEEEEAVLEQPDRNGASEESPIPSDPVGTELLSRTVPEASLEH